MEIVQDMTGLERYMRQAVVVSGDSPVLLDSYLKNAIEVDVDALADQKTAFVAGIMEHIEEAGIHSGDSACSLPPYSLPKDVIAEIERQTIELARGLGVVGLMNVQFAVQNGDIYVLEVNPRASRTVPFVSKAVGLPLAKIASRVMAGEPLADFNLSLRTVDHIAVKEAVFPFARFPGVDILLGPEMRSTGEVMGIDTSFGRAFAKSQIAGGVMLPLTGRVFISVKDQDKPLIVDLARQMIELGFEVLATRGTHRFLKEKGLEVTMVNKVLEGRPNIVDIMKNGEVDLLFNTTEGAQAILDSAELRRTALLNKIPYYTTISGARAASQAIASLKTDSLDVATLQSYSMAS